MIIQQRKTKMKQAHHQNWREWLGMLVFGLVFTAVGLLFLVVMTRVNILTCTRLEPAQYSCTLKSTLLGIVPLNSRSLDNLQRAVVRSENHETTTTDSNGQSRTVQQTVHQVVLVTTSDEIVLDDIMVNGIWQQRRADRINAFLNNPEATSLRVYSDLTSLLWIWAPLLFLAPGLLIVVGVVKGLIDSLSGLTRLKLLRA